MKRLRRWSFGAAAVVAAATAAQGISRRWANRPVEDAARSLAAGDARAAARTLLPAVAVHTTDPRAHYYLGLAYLRSGLPSAAISQLSETAHLDPGDARIRGALGHAHRAVGTPGLALREFLKAAALDPLDPSHRAEAGNVLIDDGHVEEALVHLCEAVRLAPDAADVRILLGLALCPTGDEAGMEREYRTAERIAAGKTAGEVAHLMPSESSESVYVAAHH